MMLNKVAAVGAEAPLWCYDHGGSPLDTGRALGNIITREGNDVSSQNAKKVMMMSITTVDIVAEQSKEEKSVDKLYG